MNKYRKRIVDDTIRKRLRIFGAVLICGPKGCGKTRTAKEIAKSIVEFQNEDKRDTLLQVAENKPSLLLDGDKPRLFDEWQDAPKLWGAIRKYCDDNPEKKGQFILTGSSSNGIQTPHTGTRRISTIERLPRSLYETGESNGTVSLLDLFNHSSEDRSCHSGLSIEHLIYAICRGGWPEILTVQGEEEKLYFAKELFHQTCNKDISAIDKTKRSPVYTKAIRKSISHNICTLASKANLYRDASFDTGRSESTFKEYYDALERLYIIKDIDAWCPSIRSKTSIRSTKKRNLIDPSLAVAALGLNPDYFKTDFKTLGFLFESLCIRDLQIYSEKCGGTVSYYHDRYGLEADCVLHLEDGRYALIEFKLGEHEVELGANHLCKIESLIKEYNKKEKQCQLRLPDLKVIITATEYGYKRADGVYIIPIGCLKD